MSTANPRQHWLKAIIRDRFEGNAAAFAERAKMDYTGVLLMLKGTRKISERTVVKVCSRLGVDPPETDPHLGKQRQGLAPSVVAEPTAAYGKPTERESQLMAMIERLLATNEQLVNRLGTMERIVQALEKLDTRSERPEGEGRPGKSAAR